MHLQRTDSLLPPPHQTDFYHNGPPFPNLVDFPVVTTQLPEFPSSQNSNPVTHTHNPLAPLASTRPNPPKIPPNNRYLTFAALAQTTKIMQTLLLLLLRHCCSTTQSKTAAESEIGRTQLEKSLCKSAEGSVHGSEENVRRKEDVKIAKRRKERRSGAGSEAANARIPAGAAGAAGAVGLNEAKLHSSLIHVYSSSSGYHLFLTSYIHPPIHSFICIFWLAALVCLAPLSYKVPPPFW